MCISNQITDSYIKIRLGESIKFLNIHKSTFTAAKNCMHMERNDKLKSKGKHVSYANNSSEDRKHQRSSIHLNTSAV